jgi:hypothetical protein
LFFFFFFFCVSFSPLLRCFWVSASKQKYIIIIILP